MSQIIPHSPDSPTRKGGNLSHVSSKSKINALIKSGSNNRLKLNKTIVLNTNYKNNNECKNDDQKVSEDPIKNRYYKLLSETKILSKNKSKNNFSSENINKDQAKP